MRDLVQGQVVKDLELDGLAVYVDVDSEDLQVPGEALDAETSDRDPEAIEDSKNHPLNVLGSNFFDGEERGTQQPCMLKPTRISCRLSLSPGKPSPPSISSQHTE